MTRPVDEDKYSAFITTLVSVLRRRYWREGEVSLPHEVQLKAEWVDDLCKYPPDLMLEAARLWRNSPRGYAPKSAGQLMEPVLRDYARRLATLHACNEAVELLKWYKPLPEISEEERRQRKQWADSVMRNLTGKKPIIPQPKRSEEEKQRHRESQMKFAAQHAPVAEKKDKPSLKDMAERVRIAGEKQRNKP